MTSSGNPIEAVRARLDGGRKWRKGEVGDWEGTGDVCLMGATWSALDPNMVSDAEPNAVFDVLRPIVSEQYGDRMTADVAAKPDLAYFNDHPDTTWADVDLVLDKAAIRWDEQVRP